MLGDVGEPEPVRRVRHEAAPHKVVVVTSSLPGEGKTTFADGRFSINQWTFGQFIDLAGQLNGDRMKVSGDWGGGGDIPWTNPGLLQAVAWATDKTGGDRSGGGLRDLSITDKSLALAAYNAGEAAGMVKKFEYWDFLGPILDDNGVAIVGIFAPTAIVLPSRSSRCETAG